jgi:hypothetical protein
VLNSKQFDFAIVVLVVLQIKLGVFSGKVGKKTKNQK